MKKNIGNNQGKSNYQKKSSYKRYDISKTPKTKRAISEKMLDKTIEDTFPASDATAKY
ncbi:MULTISPECIES: hypothetical protein [unclassified Legionella]|uniref:hypothetical protein n=1 Tax=unclassified Legionella TaxID=2622702 RepID=UPI0013EF85CA|nr:MULTISPECIES: hypothetical protein [unclassified Legionella]MDI9818373.1 hypothetical protein [Legionella sp. PL877]